MARAKEGWLTRFLLRMVSSIENVHKIIQDFKPPTPHFVQNLHKLRKLFIIRIRQYCNPLFSERTRMSFMDVPFSPADADAERDPIALWRSDHEIYGREANPHLASPSLASKTEFRPLSVGRGLVWNLCISQN